MLDFLLVEKLEIVGLLSMLLLVSASFTSSRWRARKYWKDIKRDYIMMKNNTNKDSNYRSISETAADRRFTIGCMVRNYENHKLAVIIMGFCSLSNIIRAVIDVNNHLVYQSFLNLDTLLVAFLSLMLTPIAYFFMRDLVQFEKVFLKKATTELELDKSINVENIALTSDASINNLSEPLVKPIFVN
jgi:hypothetical protein